MKKEILIVLIFFSLAFFSTKCLSETLLLMTMKSSPKNDNQIRRINKILSYQFNDNKLVKQDTIYSTSNFYFYGCNDKRFIFYKDRYLSNKSKIIDLQNKKLIWEHESGLREKTKRYNDLVNKIQFELKIKSDHYKKYSPNRKYYLKKTPKNIYTVKGNNKVEMKDIIVSGGTPMSIFSSAMSEIPMMWVDNRNYLYATFYRINSRRMMDEYDTGFCRAEIYNVDIKKKKSKLIAKIDTVYYAAANASFFKYPDGSVSFYYRNKDIHNKFILDFKNGKMSELDFVSCGNCFSIRSRIKGRNSRDVNYKNKLIGNLNSMTKIAFTTKEFLAIDYCTDKPFSNKVFGIKIWNKNTQEWTTIKINDNFTIIGWVNDFK